MASERVKNIASVMFWGTYVVAMFGFFNFIAWAMWNDGHHLASVAMGLVGNLMMTAFTLRILAD